MKTQDFWAGEFGNEYIERNRIDYKDRIPFWDSAIQYCTPASVLEVGCNIGTNLKAIQACAPNIDLYGVEINARAAEEARQAGFEVQCTDALGIRGIHEPGSIDLVITAGVLIHIAPDDLESVMRAIVDTSGRYVIAVEYPADEETEVVYRGHEGKLWKRDFGKLYEALGMRVISVVPEAQGFDSCTAWLLEKAQ